MYGTFTTMSTAPLIILTDPFNLATGVLLDKTITATFSETMNGSTFTSASFTIFEGSTPITGVVSYSGMMASFNPDSDFEEGKIYTARITTDVQSAIGFAMENDYTWSFTTFSSIPKVVLTEPINLSTGVALDIVVSVYFSEKMNPSTFTSSTFLLYDGAAYISGTVSDTGNIATFIPDSPLSSDKTYTATITTGAETLGGSPTHIRLCMEFCHSNTSWT
jgi:hypothetical protein